MFDQRIDSEPIPKPSRGDIDGLQPIPIPNQEPSLITQESVPVAHQERDLEILLRALIQKKERRLPAWLREAIGWGVFLGIIAIFLGIQIFLNGILSGLVNQFAIGLSVVLEIGLIWFWDLYWY